MEVSAQNIANISTAGYKRRISFADILAADPALARPEFGLSLVADLTQGKPMQTGNAFDLAISGRGFFAVRSGDEIAYTRQGQFQRDAEGRLLTSAGMALQAQGGGDIVLRSDAFEVAEDGTVLVDEEPVAKIALVDFADATRLIPTHGGAFSAPDQEAGEASSSMIRQGMLEASNVSTADEMVAMMEALRRAEAGQRMVNVYDDLMGRAISTFGQN